MDRTRSRKALPLALLAAVVAASLLAGCTKAETARSGSVTGGRPAAASTPTATILAAANAVAAIQDGGGMDAADFRTQLAIVQATVATISPQGADAVAAMAELKRALEYEAAASEAWSALINDSEMKGTTPAIWAARFPDLQFSLPTSSTDYSAGSIGFDAVMDAAFAEATKLVTSSIVRLGGTPLAADKAFAPPRVIRPDKGSALRAALMDAARVGLKTNAQFIVHQLYVDGDYALADVEPNRGGTRHAVAFHKVSGAWQVAWAGRVADVFSDAMVAAVPGIPEASILSAFSTKGHDSLSDSEVAPILPPIARRLAGELKTKVRIWPLQVYSSGSWVFFEGFATQPDGSEIDWAKVPKNLDLGDEGWVFALMQQRSGAWKIVRYIHAPYDVAWLEWESLRGVPRSIFP